MNTCKLTTIRFKNIVNYKLHYFSRHAIVRLMNSKKNTIKIILDLGCGKKKRKGSIGVDYTDRFPVNVNHNLNLFPYPFRTNYADEIYLDNVLEHLDDTLDVMREISRILKPGGFVKIIVPYFRSSWAFIDPTHKKFFTAHSFAYFDLNHIFSQTYDYTETRFFVERIIFNETHTKRSWFTKLVVRFANKWPAKYEYYISHLYPLDDITFYLHKP